MIFLDTSLIYALADRRDEFHGIARARFDRALQSRRPLVTHSYVLVESMALLERRLDLRTALAFSEDAAALEIEWVGAGLHRQALAALAAGAATSFVDQVSFAVMRQRGITEALTLDADFVAAGFDLFGATPS
jgi:predicted nucleic acid-binding protein